MKKIALSLLIFVLAVFSVWAGFSYYIEEYKLTVVVGKNAVHYVNEDIAINFKTSGHGFYREIPVRFEGSPVSAKIRKLSCSHNYISEYKNGNLSMKIGDEDILVKGLQNYNINYSYDLGADINEGYDEFYLDLLGTGWNCSTSEFQYKVYLPKEGLNLSDVKVWVTAGYYGSAQKLNCQVGENSEYYVFYGQVENLNSGQAVTMRIELPDGWYQEAREPWNYTGFFKTAAPLISVIMVLIAAVLWTLYGKDRIPVITARFNPPEGFSPMVVGFLADGSVDDKDITAMIFNWADRGLLTIKEEKKDKFSFTKKAEIEEGCPKAEKDLFNSFFKRCRVGDSITLNDLQNNCFAEAMLKAKISVTRYFTKDRLLYSKKARSLAVLVGFGVIFPLLLLGASSLFSEYRIEEFVFIFPASIAITVISILSQWTLFKKWYIRKSNVFACILRLLPVIVSYFFFKKFCSEVLCLICCLSSYILAIFSILINKRSEYGQLIMEEVLGYREFIDKVSMDELKMMIDKDPEIYYKVLSYAVVLGLEEQWSKKFDGITTANPSWYSGSNIADAMYFSKMASRMRNAVALNSVPQSSGRGVGGGGARSSGFAGGGFGGGGGRAW